MTLDPNKNIANYLLWTGTLLETALTDEEVRRGLGRIGYDEAALQALREEQRELVRLDNEIQRQRDEKRMTSASLDDAIEAAQKPYARAVELARALFRNDVERVNRFGLLQRRMRSQSGWVRQARNFFHSLASEQQALAEFARYGVSRGELENDAVRLDHVEQALSAREKETAEVREAVRLRDVALDAFDEKIDRFVSVVRVLLKEQPGVLGKLGLD